MADKEKFVAKYLLNDISENLVGMPYSSTDKPEHEIINEAVSTKVIPLLSETERIKLVGKGADAKTRLWVYETMKSWKKSYKAPGTAEMRLILAKYYGYTDWKSCFNHYLPIAQQLHPSDEPTKRSMVMPSISINLRSFMFVAVTIFIGIIAYTLFNMQQLFSRMAEDRPVVPRKIEKTSPEPILVSNDSSTNENIIKPEKDLRPGTEDTAPPKTSVVEKAILETEKTKIEEKKSASKPRVSPRKAIRDLGLSWDAKSLAESMSRGDMEAVSLFVEGGFPLQSDYEGASVVLYAYHENAIDPVGVTDQLLKLGFDFTELLVDRKLIRQTSTDLPISFWDDRLPKYDSYNKTFQGTLMMWLAQMVMWRGEKNQELTVMKKLNERFTFDITPKFIYHVQRTSGIPYPELQDLFADQLIEAKKEAFDLKRALRFMSYWPEEYEVDRVVYHPVVPKDKEHIYVQKKGTFEIEVKPIDAGDFTDLLLQRYMEGENPNRFMDEFKTYGLGRNQFSSLADEIIFVFLYVTNESTTEMYKTVQPNYYNVGHDMVMVCPKDQTELIDFLVKNEVGSYDAAAIMTTGDPKTYYLNLYARDWKGETRAVVTDKKGIILHEFDSNEALKNYLIHGR